MRYLIFSLFAILLAGAVVFAQERFLFCDAAYIFTQILNHNTLELYGEHRYGAFITQMVPLFAGKMHIPIATSLMMYSVSFNLFYLIVASIILFRFKNTRLAIVMAFYYTLFVTETYFWTNNEVHQAMAWMFLLFGTILHFRKRHYPFMVHLPLFLVLAFLAIFTHPLSVVIFPFLWLFFLLDKEAWPYSQKETIILSLVVLSICLVKYMLMSGTSYDSQKVRPATHFSIEDILLSFSSEMMKTMGRRFLTHYFFVPLLFIAGMVAAVKAKKKQHIALVFFFTIGYLIILSLTFTSFTAFYTESEWMPFAIITTILFVYYALPKLKPATAMAVLSLVFAVRLGYIAKASILFSERKEWIFSVLDRMKDQGITKGYVIRDKKTDSLLMMNWGVPTESLLASAWLGDKPHRTFVVESEENIKKMMPVKNYDIIYCFEVMNRVNLNSFYFQIDTISPYQPVDMKAGN